MGTITHFVYVLGFVVFIFGIVFGNLLKTLLGIRFKKGGCELRQRSEVPEYLKPLFDSCETQLTHLGFVFSHCQLFDDPVAIRHSLRWNLIYVNSKTGSYAGVSTSATPEPSMPVKIEFVSNFAGGHRLVTLNGAAHEIVGEMPNVTLVDRYAESLEKQYQAHLEELAILRQEKKLGLLSPEMYVKWEKADAVNYITHLQKEGLLKETEPGIWRLRFVPAVNHCFRLLSGQNKVKAMRAKIQKYSREQGLPVADIPVEAEAQAFHRTKELTTPNKTGLIGKIGVFLVSLFIFIMMFGISFDARVVLMLVLALGFHELGHVLGMRLFGHKDIQVLFLPFGAATIGIEKKATLIQKVIIYLLGPAPGIVLGASLLLIDQVYDVAFLRDFGLFLLVLNYLNMLPIFPLDGGRVVELALFSRCQILKVIFLIISVFLLATAAVFTKDTILTGFAVILGVGIFPQIQKSKVASKIKLKIRDEKLEISDEVIVPEFFKIMKEKPYDKFPFAKKFNVVKELLSSVGNRPPTVGISVASMLMYGTVFFLPVIMIIIWALSILFISTGGHYGQGIVSFVPSPDGEYVFVTRTKSFIATSGLVVDKNGGLLVDFGKRTGCLNSELTWRPGPEKGWLLYWRGMASGVFAVEPKDKARMVLYNLDTRDSVNIVHLEKDTENLSTSYVKWSDNGGSLFGTKMDTSDASWRLTAIVRHDVTTGECREHEILQSGTGQSICKFLPAHNKAMLYASREEDAETLQFTILDMTGFEEKAYELDKEVAQWEIAADGKTMIVLEKIFSDNMVRYRLAARDMEDDAHKVLLESPILPQYSFEDAARGKAAHASFQISPKHKWVVCSSTTEQRKEAYYLVDPFGSGHCRLLESDSDKYYVSITYSPDETRLCALYSPGYEQDPNELDVARLEIYDIRGAETNRIASLEVDEDFFAYEFLGNQRLLYIRRGEDRYWWRNTNELWVINIADGTKEPFVRGKSSADEGP